MVVGVVKPMVYVAGPITGGPFGCVRQSIEAFDFLRAIGAVPFCPQWSVLPAMVSERPYEAWMTYDFDVLARCDALLRMPGESPGADREVAHALKVVGIPAVYWTAEGRAALARAIASWDRTRRLSLVGAFYEEPTS